MKIKAQQKLNILAIIPVRMESARLPNKPLAKIAGKALVLWVWEHARRAKCFSKVVIATDSEEIKAVALEAGAEVVMTSTTPLNGTERVSEALDILGGNWDLIFNVQGDMPFIQPSVIDEVAEAFERNLNFDMATLALPIKDEAEYNNLNCVKVVFAENQRALYFSRSAIPHYRNGVSNKNDLSGIASASNSSQVPISYKHIGLYAFRPEALKAIVKLAPTTLEKAESLEQLRALEHNQSILVVSVPRETAGPSIEVDTLNDLEKANEIAKTYLMP